MPRLINATTLRAEFTGNFNELWHYTGIWAVIDNAPTVDAVEVVRCKDCKHYSYLGSCLLHSEIADEYSTGFDFRMDDNDFCSYGERKEV